MADVHQEEHDEGRGELRSTVAEVTVAHLQQLIDRQLPELLHLMLELRELVQKHTSIIQNYFLQVAR